jgi:ATP synthase I chain
MNLLQTKSAAVRMTVFVAFLGLATSLAVMAAGGVHAGLSSAAGAALALANFLLLRTIVQKIVTGDMHRKLPVVALLFFKMGAVMALVSVMILREWVAPIPFTIGLSSLAVGLIANSLLPQRERDTRQSEY